MAATTFGCVMGPFISGFLSAISRRLTFWFGLILAGITLPFFIALPEAYLPVLLLRKARKLLQETGNQELVALCELEKRGARHYGHHCSDETILDAYLRMHRPVQLSIFVVGIRHLLFVLPTLSYHISRASKSATFHQQAAIAKKLT